MKKSPERYNKEKVSNIEQVENSLVELKRELNEFVEKWTPDMVKAIELGDEKSYKRICRDIFKTHKEIYLKYCDDREIKSVYEYLGHLARIPIENTKHKIREQRPEWMLSFDLIADHASLDNYQFLNRYYKGFDKGNNAIQLEMERCPMDEVSYQLIMNDHLFPYTKEQLLERIKSIGEIFEKKVEIVDKAEKKEKDMPDRCYTVSLDCLSAVLCNLLEKEPEKIKIELCSTPSELEESDYQFYRREESQPRREIKIISTGSQKLTVEDKKMLEITSKMLKAFGDEEIKIDEQQNSQEVTLISKDKLYKRFIRGESLFREHWEKPEKIGL